MTEKVVTNNYRNGNYTAFYVDEPFCQNNLGANRARDFCTYRLIQAWKENDSTFPFCDSHNKTYNVRDDSDFEQTLKPRLRERLNKSKNIILILSSITKNSRALHEEIDYGINTLGLPIIVVYPEYNSTIDIADDGHIKDAIRKLWDKLPIFRDAMNSVPTLHIPFNKSILKLVLEDTKFTVQSKCKEDIYFFRT